jgi:streptogramin lyase
VRNVDSVRRRHLLLASLIVALGLTASCAAASTSGPLAGPTPASTPREPTPSPPAGSPKAPSPLTGVHVAQLNDAPGGLLRVGDEVWVALPAANAVRGEGGRELPVAGAPSRMARVEDEVWVSASSGGSIHRLDSAGIGLGVIGLPAGAEPQGLAFDGSVVWVVDRAHDELLGVDRVSAAVVKTVGVDRGPRLVAATDGLVVASSFDANTVTVFSAEHPDDARAFAVPGCAGPQGVAVADELIWVACTTSGEIVAVDPRDDSVAVRADLADADAVVVVGSLVVAAGQLGPTLIGIDATSRQVSDPVVIDNAPAGGTVDLAYLEDEVVVSHSATKRLYAVQMDLLLP